MNETQEALARRYRGFVVTQTLAIAGSFGGTMTAVPTAGLAKK